MSLRILYLGGKNKNNKINLSIHFCTLTRHDEWTIHHQKNKKLTSLQIENQHIDIILCCLNKIELLKYIETTYIILVHTVLFFNSIYRSV